MFKFVQGIAGALALSVLTLPASSATLTEGQIVQSLAGAGAAAQAANLDIAAIRADIDRRIRVEGTENAASPPPVLQALAKMPNLTVQIQFAFNSDWICPRRG